MHSTSFTSSHDQSTESVGQTIQRSGLAMTVGDTKSIVLALQALQEKIRKLEQDRNFHQDQCEKAQRSHEAYKLEIEGQLDSERSQHRVREQELQDLLARANAERSRLQSTLEESKSDLGHFRVELEQMLSTERTQARTREDQLLSELEQIRSDLSDERKQAESLASSLDKLKAEKDLIENTNRRLESTVRELITVQNNLMDSVKKGGATVLNSGGMRTASAARGRSKQTHTDPTVNISVTSRRVASRETTTRRTAGSGRMSYMNPTHASAIRDVRNGEIQGRCPTPPRPPSPRATSRTVAHSRSLNTSSQVPPEQMQAMDEVFEELQDELRDLETKYKQSIQDAARDDTSPESLNAVLNQLMGQIQRKTEQIRLMRQTKMNLSGSEQRDQRTGSSSRPPVKGIEKALHRSQIVGELRALFAKPSSF